MTDALISKMKSIGGFSDEEIDFFVSKLEDGFIAKGDYFLKEGQVCRHLAFIQSGLAMDAEWLINCWLALLIASTSTNTKRTTFTPLPCLAASILWT